MNDIRVFGDKLRWPSISLRKDLLAFLLYCIVAAGFMAPMSSTMFWSSHEYADTYQYLQGIHQSRLALDEGQLPPRVAPDRWDGWRYPLFQWYSPLPFFAGGILCKLFSPDNPLIPLRILLWLVLVLGAMGACKMAAYFSRSYRAGVITGVAFMTTPYLLVITHTGYKLHECLSMSLLPILVYYSVRCFASPKRSHILASGILWGLLCLSYGLTFIYSSLFIGGLLFLFTRWNRKGVRRLMRTGVAYAIGLGIAAWHMIPIALISKYFEMDFPKYGITPLAFHYPVPLFLALSPTPIPLLEPGALIFTCLRVGWPLLFGTVIVGYALMVRGSKQLLPKKIALPVLILWLVALVGICSKLEFVWQHVPDILLKIQFTHRLFIQLAWLGAILLAFALKWLFKPGLSTAHVAIGVLVIGIAGASSLPTDRVQSIDGKTSVQPVEKTLGANYNNEFNHGRAKTPDTDYEVYGAFVMNRYMYATNELFGNVESPILQDYFGWLITEPIPNIETCFLNTSNIRLRKLATKRHWQIDDDVTLPLPAEGAPSSIRLAGGIPMQSITNPVILTAYVNGSIATQMQLKPGAPYDLQIPLPFFPPGTKSFRLKFKADRAFQMTRANEINDNIGRDKRIFYAQSLKFEGLPPSQSVIPVQAIQNKCFMKNDSVECTIEVPNDARIIQMPALFYPDMFEVKVDGKSHPAFPTFQRPYHWLTSVRLPPGPHRISVRFTGLKWANWISWITWLGVIVACGLGIIQKHSRSRSLTAPNQKPVAKPRTAK